MISVIVPVFNEDKRIERCINSILCQSYENIELILVDDGSTDSSPEICDNWAKKDNRVKVIHKKNEGRVRARNTGLDNALGEWVVYVDSDDWIESSMLSEMMDIQTKCNVDVVIAPKMVRDDDLCGTYDERLEGLWEKEKLLNIFWDIAPSMCSKLFRKSVLDKCQYDVDPAITYGEDMLCVRICMLNVKSVYIMNKSFYHYTTNHGQRRYDENYIENIFLLAEILKKHVEKAQLNSAKEKIQLGLTNFVVKSIVNFGFGTVFGSSNTDSKNKKIEKVKMLSKQVQKSHLFDKKDLDKLLNSREIRWWSYFEEEKIRRLYLEVRAYALWKKIRRKVQNSILHKIKK